MSDVVLDPDEWVTIRHPDPEVGGNTTSQVTRLSYDAVWEAKGFVLVEPIVAEASAVAGEPVDSLGSLTKAQLEELAASKGVDTSGMTKAEIVSALEGS